MENAVTLNADEIRIADNYNREYPGMTRDQAVAKAKQVLADIAARGKELPPVIVSKPVNHHIAEPRTPAPRAADTQDAYRDGMIDAFNRAADKLRMEGEE